MHDGIQFAMWRADRDSAILLGAEFVSQFISFYSSGTFGMEAVARQFATDEHVMVIRNGWFSFRWTEIFDMGGPTKQIPTSHTVFKAQPHPVEGSPHCNTHPIRLMRWLPKFTRNDRQFSLLLM